MRGFKPMNKRKFFGLSIVASACLAISLSVVAMSKQNDVKMVRSGAMQYNITWTKDDIYASTSYRNNDSYSTNIYAFFQLKYPGTYGVISNESYNGGTYGGDHLYSNIAITEGARYSVSLDVDGFAGAGWHFWLDKQHEHEIYTPGFVTLTKIQYTLGTDCNVPYDTSYYRNINKVTKEGNVITLEDSNICAKVTGILLLDVIPDHESAGKLKLSIDSISLTYTCQYNV